MTEVNDESTSYLHNGHQIPQKIDEIARRNVASSEGSSDSEGGERPVRDKLKKTSIAGLSSKARAGTDKGSHPFQEAASTVPAQVSTSDQATTSSRGRPARKRSFDDLQDDGSTATSQAEANDPPHAKNGHHKRMRSRDVSSGEHVSLAGRSDNGIATPLEEESDMDAQKSPGGPGVLVDAAIDETVTPPPDTFTDAESMISPKKKRSRDHFDKERSSILDAPVPEVQNSSHNGEGEPDKKRYREEEQLASTTADEPAKPTAPSSGFANASVASPFGSFASPKKSTFAPEFKPSEPNAFKSSGLSAFASSERSPFGAVRSTTTSSGFGGTTSSGSFSTAPATRGIGGASTIATFGNVGATSPFAGKSVASFGSLAGLPSTGGFASSSSFGSGLAGGLSSGLSIPPPLGEGRSAFGGPTGSTTTFGGPSTTRQKAFGAPEADEDSGSGDDSSSQNDEEGEGEESHAREARLKEQIDRETGEEDEEVVIKCRAKLYHFENKEWKERGVGDLKVNVRFELKESSDEEGQQYERKARIIMRTEHVHRVVLNTPILKGMKVGSQSGDEPSGKFLNLAGMENGKPALFMLKIGKEEVVRELYQRIKELQEDP